MGRGKTGETQTLMRISQVCTPQRVTIRGLFGDQEIWAWRYGDWAAHSCIDDPGRFVLTLLPIGLCLPPDWCSFADIRRAVSAMIEIARLRNDWARILQIDFTPELKTRIEAIAKRHGATTGPVALAVDADHSQFGVPVSARPNGYRMFQP